MGQQFIVDNQIGGKVYKGVNTLGPQMVFDVQRKREAGCVLHSEGLLVGCLLIKEFPKWIITCLCSEVSWHSWIPQEPCLSTGQL